jgi:hypothetical protein
VSTSIVSLRLTVFAFSAEEIQIVATEDLMNAQIRRTEPYPGVFKRVHSSTIETSMIDLQLFIGPLPKLHYRRLALKWQLVSFPMVCSAGKLSAVGLYAYQTRRVYACLQRLGERASLTRELVRLMRPSRVDSLTLLTFQNRSESRCIALG